VNCWKYLEQIITVLLILVWAALFIV